MNHDLEYIGDEMPKWVAEGVMNHDLEYIGDEMPKWVAEGVEVRVKHTPVLRRYGLQINTHCQDRTWPGEIGVIRRVECNGWWCWHVDFPRGLSYSLRLRLLEDLVRVPKRESTSNDPERAPDS